MVKLHPDGTIEGTAAEIAEIEHLRRLRNATAHPPPASSPLVDTVATTKPISALFPKGPKDPIVASDVSKVSDGTFDKLLSARPRITPGEAGVSIFGRWVASVRRSPDYGAYRELYNRLLAAKRRQARASGLPKLTAAAALESPEELDEWEERT